MLSAFELKQSNYLEIQKRFVLSQQEDMSRYHNINQIHISILSQEVKKNKHSLFV